MPYASSPEKSTNVASFATKSPSQSCFSETRLSKPRFDIGSLSRSESGFDGRGGGGDRFAGSSLLYGGSAFE
jgi:hypothetical protein